MSDTIKGMVICFIILVLWSIGCFSFGYILSDRQATKRIEQTNNELAEQQRKYDELIKSTDERIRDIREQLSTKVSDNGKATKELSGIIEQIRKQKLDIQI